MKIQHRIKDAAPKKRSRSGYGVLCVVLAIAVIASVQFFGMSQDEHTERNEKEMYLGAGTPIVLDGAAASDPDYNYNGAILRFMSGADGKEYEISQTLPAGSSQDIRIEYGTVTITVDNINITGNIEVSVGAALNLLLRDTNEISGSITVPAGAELNIYSESGSDAIDTLKVTAAAAGNAGIGGINLPSLRDAGTITINGGTVNAYGADGDSAGTYAGGGAGIGGAGGASAGSDGGSCGSVTINGGIVNAYGGGSTVTTYSGGGAGIGGGAGTGSAGRTGNGGTITISAGSVFAQGGEIGGFLGGGGAGIGGGHSAGPGQGDTILIDGGIVNAYGGERGAGIGGGNRGYSDVTITGGSVYAEGGQYGAGVGTGHGADTISLSYTITVGGDAYVEAVGGNDGSGIGGGVSTSSTGTSGNVSEIIIGGGAYVKATGIENGAGIGGHGIDGVSIIRIGGTAEVFAYGGITPNFNNGGAGIGSNSQSQGGNISIEITGGTVVAEGGTHSAGIGGGAANDGGTITITGGSIVATGGDPIGGSTAGGGAGIGGGDGSYGMYGTGGNITIGGNAQVTATGGWGAAGIGGGASIGSSIESDGGVIKIGDDAVVTAIGGDGGAGIGGGTNSGSSGADNGSGGNITVGSDARVTATGSGGGAGIGGGARISGPGGNGGTIIINSGTVIATGGSGGGAGIGGGSGGNGAAFTTYSAAYIEAYSYYQGAGSRPAIHASNSPTLGDGWYVNAFFTTPFLSPMTLNVFEEGDTDVLLAALTLPANYRAFAFQIPPGSSAAKDYNVYAETATGPEPVVHDDADESAVISSVKSLTGYSGHGGTDGALPVKMGVTLYTVTFDPDNVTDMPWTELAAAGGHLTEPTGYTKAGYIIDGWYEGAVKWDFGTDTVSGDMTLTAKWTAVWEATVNLTLDGSAWDGQTVELYSGAIKVADLIDSAGSYSAEVIDGTYAIYVNGTDTGETITIFGAPDSVTLDYFTLTLNTSTGISSVTGDGIYLSGSVVSIDAVVSAGYIWEKWVEITTTGIGEDTNKSTSVTVNDTIELTATAAVPVYTLTVYLTLDAVAWDGQTVELYVGAVKMADLTDNADGSYDSDVIDGTYAIYVNGDDTGRTVTISGAPDNVTIDYFTLTLNAGTGISSVTGGGIYIDGSVVNIDAAVSSGYVWEKWVEITTTGIGEDINKSTSVMMSDTIELTATATVSEYTVTVIADEGSEFEYTITGGTTGTFTVDASGMYEIPDKVPYGSSIDIWTTSGPVDEVEWTYGPPGHEVRSVGIFTKSITEDLTVTAKLLPPPAPPAPWPWAVLAALGLLFLLIFLDDDDEEIFGKVTHNGKGAEGVSIVYMSDDSVRRTVTTDRDGDYSIPVTVGSVVVILDAVGYSSSAVSIDGTAAQDGLPLRVKAEKDRTRVNITVKE